MYSFNQTPAFKKLLNLAKDPIDLSQEGVLTPERIESYSTESLGYRFLYATERITDDVLSILKELAVESGALDKMSRMQSGEVLNKIEGFESESRAVLHTATRDFFEDPNLSEVALDAAKTAHREILKLKDFLKRIDDQFTDLILIGIGGSELGPQAHYLALQHLQKPGRNVFFIGNVDPDNASAVLRKANLKKALVLIVSKSGTTLETLANEIFVKEWFICEGLNPAEHFVAVTGEGSPLDDKTKYLESFYIWDWIGGRYSSTSMVGGVLLAFAFGFDVYWEFLKGAHAMDKAALNPDIQKNLPLLSALIGIWNRNFLKIPTFAILPYSQPLSRYPAHIQQLDMESNGKHVDKNGHFVTFDTGPVIWGEPGTNAQHSFFQLIHQGTATVALEFVGFKANQYGIDQLVQGTTSQDKLLSNLFAQAIAFAVGQKDKNPNKAFDGNRPSHILLGSQLTPFALGALLSYYENRVAFQGFIWNINSFDQEGVQLGKVLANKIIGRLAEKTTSQPGRAYPLGDAYLKQLELL